MSNKKKLVDAVKNMVSSQPIKIKFIDIICQQMSERTLLNLNKTELHDFIHTLYDFFIVQHHQGSTLYFGKPALSAKHLTNRLILQISQPDAAHLVVTIEEIFRKYKLRSTRCIHPIIGIRRDAQGEVSDIVRPDQSFERRSLIFIAFEDIPSPDLIETIKSELSFHIDCVQNAHKDADAIQDTLQFVADQLPRVRHEESSEWVQLVSWLNDQNFSFFGAHVIDRNGQQSQVKTALGICRPDMNMNALVTPNDTLLGHPKATPFLVDHTRIPSPIQRFTPLMRISFKFNTTQYVFYGILKRSSMYAKNMDTPILRKKMAHIFNERQFLPGSYDYNDVIRIFNDIPKFELFRTHQRDLLTMVDFIMSITNLNHVQCFPLFASKTNLIFYFVIPYYLFTPRAITLITDYVKDIIPHTHCDTLPINAPEKCRIHMHFTLDTPPQLPDEDTLERSLTTLIQPWEDQVRASLIRDFPESLKNEPQIIDKIPSHYRVRTRPDAAIRDIRHLMSLTSKKDIRFEFMSFSYPPTSDLANKASLLLIYHQTKLDLTNILPILHHLGIHVIDQITSRFGDETDTLGYILAFRLLDTSLQKINEPHVKDRLIHALESIFKHKLPNDPLNGLILSTTLTAETLFILQGIRNYVYQVFSTLYSMASINQALLTHPSFSENLGQLFICKFDPTKTNNQRLSAIISLNNQLKSDIKSVQNISDDQILRRCLSVVTACVRSNYFFKAPTDALSFKFKCEDIFGIPTPIPYRETMVFDSEMEGVHIRFGAVARGGLRWSDRLDDYRTEVLGLVRTQQTKNAVIIPVGSKGGFVVKTPNPTPEMAQHQYKRFITAMLQLADNIIDNQPVINDQRIAYDDVDPYFVVAADKGTATFSDIANDVSISHDFWLGDGFASGGQYGYDHKKVGITAKGAWECTKLHFKAIGKNPETDMVRVAGVGDMSGDVFGNGLLLSDTIQLVAAFNHMHIFIDPNPDPQRSFKERQRLFSLPKSTWKSYEGISDGGGVFDRSAKEIHCSKPMQDLLGISSSVVSGNELIQAILTMSVDLLWFGGIGTYIKASTESHIDVGDPTNNAVRVNATQVRAAIIGEGANLGITQKARIEYERNNGRINTDAIDNSAGVNMSDYEVNIKIILSTLLQQGHIQTTDERNRLLEKATDQVTALVLKNNVAQHELISMDRYRSMDHPFMIDHTISTLIQLGQLNHIDEQIPTSKERHELYRQSLGLPRCVLAKCQAYTKMRIKNALADATLFQGARYTALYVAYFPTDISTLVPPNDFPDHRLKHDIIITELTNHFVGIYGCSAYESMTFSNTIPIDQAIHHLWLLEARFNIPEKRQHLMGTPTEIQDMVRLNNDLLYAILLCHVMNVSLEHHSSTAIKDEISHFPLAIQCLLMAPTYSNTTHRLNQLEDRIGFMSNLTQLMDLAVSSQVMQDQKVSVLTDLYQSIIRALTLSDQPWNQLLAQSDTLSPPISSNKDRLASLFLYSYRLRHALIKIID